MYDGHENLSSLHFLGKQTKILNSLELLVGSNCTRIYIPKNTVAHYMHYLGKYKNLTFEEGSIFNPIEFNTVSVLNFKNTIRLARIDSFRDERSFGFLHDLMTNEKFFFHRSAVTDNSIYVPFNSNQKEEFHEKVASGIVHGIEMNNKKLDKYKKRLEGLNLGDYIETKNSCEYGDYLLRITVDELFGQPWYRVSIPQYDFRGFPPGSLEWGQLVAYKVRETSNHEIEVYDIKSWANAKQEVTDSMGCFSFNLLSLYSQVVPSVRLTSHDFFKKRIYEILAGIRNRSDFTSSDESFRLMFKKRIKYLVDLEHSEFCIYNQPGNVKIAYNDDVRTTLECTIDNETIETSVWYDEHRPGKPTRRKQSLYRCTNIYCNEIADYRALQLKDIKEAEQQLFGNSKITSLDEVRKM